MACFGLKVFFLWEFGPQNHNCLVRIKFGNYSNSSKLSYFEYSMVIFILLALVRKHPSLAIFCDRKLNLPVCNGNWFPDQFQYVEICGNVHALGEKCPFGGKYPREAPWKYFF